MSCPREYSCNKSGPELQDNKLFCTCRLIWGNRPVSAYAMNILLLRKLDNFEAAFYMIVRLQAEKLLFPDRVVKSLRESNGGEFLSSL